MKKLKALVLIAALLVAPAALAQTLCWYPSICSRIECYFATPAIANALTDQQIGDFVWYYVTFCWV